MSSYIPVELQKRIRFAARDRHPARVSCWCWVSCFDRVAKMVR